MRRTLLNLISFVFCLSTSCYSQDFSALWQGHFSYNTIIDVVKGENKIYAAAENAIFEYDVLSGAIKTITTVEGLSGAKITTISYSDAYQSLLIGYETGLIEVYSQTDASVLSVVAILEKQNISPVNKRINHFYEHEGFVYISTDYGISVYDLERLEFGDTYFLGNGGTQITVTQVSVLNNEIYAACLNGNGIKKGSLSNPNLIDFQQWQTLITGDYYSMSAIGTNLYAVRSNNQLYQINGTSISALFSLPQLPLDAEVSDGNLIYATTDAIYVYDASAQLISSFQPTADFDTSFTSATLLDTFVYIGTNDLGVLQASLANNSGYLEIKPNGPLFNSAFRLDSYTETVWTTFGDYTPSLNPSPIRRRGISYYKDEQWYNIPADDVLGALNLSELSVNIFNPTQVFISAFQNGILELNNFEPTILYNASNSGLESLILPGAPDFSSIRVSDTAFDSEGLLWSLTSRVDRALKSYNPATGNWQGYSFSSLIENPLLDELGFFEIAIDANGTKWVGSYSNGLLAYNESIATNPLRNINGEDRNVPPFSRVTALALDNRNQLWIGTTLGLRLLFNTAGFYEDPNPRLSSIIILEDGIPKELLEGQSITDIEVDGSNNKWIATADSGVFYFSSDGQTTIYHFTEDNSPLPSNRINDIALDLTNGLVYIASSRGLVAFKAGGSKTQDSLEDAFVYPNPVRPEYNILGFDDLNDINKGVKITGLTENVNIKITDIEGNLVAEAQSNINQRSSNTRYNFAIDGGTAVWNGKNLGNSVVRTGVYLVLISDLESFESKVLKVLIVR